MLVLSGLLLTSVFGVMKMALVDGGGGILSSMSAWNDQLEVLAGFHPALRDAPTWLKVIKLLLFTALGGETLTAGNNLAMIITRMPQDMPQLSGAYFLNDLGRALLPGFLVAPTLEATGGYYNKVVFPGVYDSGGGVGFSIIGYGYLNFGVGGAIGLIAIIAGLIRQLYRWASRSGLGLLFYIGFVPVGIYIARTDISGPLSQGLKHVLVPLVAMYIVGVLVSRSSTGAPRIQR